MAAVSISHKYRDLCCLLCLHRLHKLLSWEYEEQSTSLPKVWRHMQLYKSSKDQHCKKDFTCNDGNFVGEPLRHSGDDGHFSQRFVHLRHQHPVLLVLHVVVDQR